MTAISPTRREDGAIRWLMLSIISLGFISLTLNWFDVATAFGLIGAEFKVGLPSLSYLISLFIVGYGAAHIPGGMLATKIGMKRTLVLGLVVQGLAGIMSGLSYSYLELEWFRAICGIGGSAFIAVGFAAVVVWFRQGEVSLALGLSGGAAFSAGAAFALYIWIYLQNATSWHTSLVLAGVFELIVAAITALWFRTPADAPALAGARFDAKALAASVSSRDLWLYGLALLGGYGAYFTTSQLFTTYATADRHFDPSLGGLLSALIVLAGVPGGLLGGYWADRSRNLKAFVVGALLACAIGLVLIPVVPTGALWAVGIGIGFFLIFGFAAWSSVPSRVSRIRHEYVGTATGLMLTLAAVGGFFIPIIFGHLVAHTSFATGWVFLAIVTVAFALIGLAGRNATSDVPEPALVPASSAAGPYGPRSAEEEAV
ncbi:MAG: MFS transporter [Trebonia sp.]|jgi:nitrate/nitrite transporter NarK